MSDEMKKIFIGLILFLFTVQATFAQEPLTISLSKDRYVIGEDIVVNFEIYNPYNEDLNATWFVWFEPPIREYAIAPGGEGLISPGEYRYETYNVETEVLGEHVAVARLVDSEGNILYEQNARFSVEEKESSEIYITILLILIIVILFFYQRKKKF